MTIARAVRLVGPLILITLVSPHVHDPRLAAQTVASDPRFDRVVAAVQAKMKELGIPGIAVGVLADGVVHTRALGVTNVDHPLPVSDDTLFQIGSISKTFTGTAIMRLVEQGKLRLDDPIRKHLPRFAVKDADASVHATIRDTLTHMGGWEGDFFDDPSHGDDALERMVERMATLEQTANVGEMWGYNNAGFYIAGRVIEVLTGKPFERAIKELVLVPLGIEQAYYFPADVMTRRFVVGHGALKGAATVLTPWAGPRAGNSVGGITTNVATLLRYAAFHMGDGTSVNRARVLSPASLEQMRRTVVAKAGTDETMGLTWHLSRVGGLTAVEHGGATTGQRSHLRFVPDRRFALAVVTNSGRGDMLNVHAWRVAMQAYFDVALLPPSPIGISSDAMSEYAGTYRRQAQDVIVTIQGNGLKIEVTPKLPALDGKVPPPSSRRVGFFARDRLIALDGPTAGEATGEFIRDTSGRVAWLRIGVGAQHAGRILRRTR